MENIRARESWNACVRRDKTFLHVVSDDDQLCGLKYLRKYFSEPDLHKFTDDVSNMCFLWPIMVDQFQNVQIAFDDEQTKKPQMHMDDIAKKVTKQRKKIRPCKGQRVRRKKMMDRLKAEICEDPEVFDAGSAVLLPSVMNREQFKTNAIARLEAYKEQIIRERELETTLVELVVAA